jgi:hypothetical protein
MVDAVLFDLGETRVDATEAWGDRADWLSALRLTRVGALGGAIAWGGHHPVVVPLVRPGFDFEADAPRREKAGRRAGVGRGGSTRQRRPNRCSTSRRTTQGCGSDGAVGQQPAGPGVLPPDHRGLAHPGSGIAYVVDRIDNDVRPAAAAGIFSIFIRRGPWAFVQSNGQVPAEPSASVDSLNELPPILDGLRDRAD